MGKIEKVSAVIHGGEKKKKKRHTVSIAELVKFHKLSTRECDVHKTNAISATLSHIFLLYFVLKN